MNELKRLWEVFRLYAEVNPDVVFVVIFIIAAIALAQIVKNLGGGGKDS